MAQKKKKKKGSFPWMYLFGLGILFIALYDLSQIYSAGGQAQAARHHWLGAMIVAIAFLYIILPPRGKKWMQKIFSEVIGAVVSIIWWVLTPLRKQYRRYKNKIRNWFRKKFLF